MQKFTLIHDGSPQAWQTAYLAFHIAARLGAPLQVLLTDSVVGEETTTQRASNIEVGGRAAGVAIDSRLITDLAVDTLVENTAIVDGLFVPRHLITDEETAIQFLDGFSCPLWIVSKESETRRLAVLVGNPSEADVFTYAATLSHRLGGLLSGLYSGTTPPVIPNSGMEPEWILIDDLSDLSLVSALQRIDADLLFLNTSRISLIRELTCTCVVYPESKMLK